MKYKSIILFAAAALFAIACGKQDYPAYEWGEQDDTTVVKTEVFFPKTAEVLELDPSVDTVTVTLGRTVNTEALSVPLVVKNPSSAIIVPATAEFEAGAATTTIDIDISGMEIEVTYEVSISIPQDYVYLYKKTSSAVSAQSVFRLSALKQQWDPAGYCTYYDINTICDGMAYAENVPIENHHGTNDFRIVAPYAAIGGESFTDDLVNFPFTVKKSGENYSVTIPDGIYNFWPSSGYGIYWNTSRYSSYCYTSIEYDAEEGVHYIDISTLGLTLSKMSPWPGGHVLFYWYDCPVEFPVPEAEEGGEEGGE